MSKCSCALLLVGSICLSACSLTHRLTPEEARCESNRTYGEIVIPAKISGVVLEVQAQAIDSVSKDTSISVMPQEKKVDTLKQLRRVLIHFDSLGGRLVPDSQLVVGHSVNGDSIALPMDSVVFLQFRGVDRGQSMMTVQAAQQANDYVLGRPGQKVGRGRYANWNVIQFDSRGATIDPAAGRISGTSARGVPVSADLDDVVTLTWSESLFRQVERHPYRLVRVAVALLVAGVLVLGPIQQAF
ncbi:MAG: hypothetical protein WAU88_12550 [Candidatus Zixiibacteriota bacterium]